LNWPVGRQAHLEPPRPGVAYREFHAVRQGAEIQEHLEPAVDRLAHQAVPHEARRWEPQAVKACQAAPLTAEQTDVEQPEARLAQPPMAMPL
jgi:hypothetical protein